jgi:hypothetical protein
MCLSKNELPGANAGQESQAQESSDEFPQWSSSRARLATTGSSGVRQIAWDLGHRDGHHPRDELGAVAATRDNRRSGRSCHLRADGTSVTTLGVQLTLQGSHRLPEWLAVECIHAGGPRLLGERVDQGADAALSLGIEPGELSSGGRHQGYRSSSALTCSQGIGVPLSWRAARAAAMSASSSAASISAASSGGTIAARADRAGSGRPPRRRAQHPRPPGPGALGPARSASHSCRDCTRLREASDPLPTAPGPCRRRAAPTPITWSPSG